jgi:hypothetical protein
MERNASDELLVAAMGEKFIALCRIWNFADVIIGMGFNTVYSGRANCCLHPLSVVYSCLFVVERSVILLYSPLRSGTLCDTAVLTTTSTVFTVMCTEDGDSSYPKTLLPRTKLHTVLRNKTIILMQARERKILQAEVWV